MNETETQAGRLLMKKCSALLFAVILICGCIARKEDVIKAICYPRQGTVDFSQGEDKIASEMGTQNMSWAVMRLPADSPLLSGNFEWMQSKASSNLIYDMAAYYGTNLTFIAVKDADLVNMTRKGSYIHGMLKVDTSYGLKATLIFDAQRLSSPAGYKVLSVKIPRKGSATGEGAFCIISNSESQVVSDGGAKKSAP